MCCAPSKWPCLILLSVFFAGCKSKKSDQSAVHEQTPDQTVEKIMVSYDTNRDGSLDASELNSCPSLKTLLKSMNKGANGKISREELQQRIQDMHVATIRTPAVSCAVTMNGLPLPDAEITLTMESFHGSAAETVNGKTDANGRAELTGNGGILNGFYRVSISRPVDGVESIPARFNSASTVGVEVSPHSYGRGGTLSIDVAGR